MNYLEFLESVTDETLKKKMAYEVSGEKWFISSLEEGIRGACDKYMELFAHLIPKKQKNTESPRYQLYFYLKNKEGSNQVMKDLDSPLMMLFTRNSEAKNGCKQEYGYGKSWNCESHVRCQIGLIGDDFMALLSNMNLELLRTKTEVLAEVAKSKQPYGDDAGWSGSKYSTLEVDSLKDIEG